jgi:hypothetical protein
MPAAPDGRRRLSRGRIEEIEIEAPTEDEYATEEEEVTGRGWIPSYACTMRDLDTIEAELRLLATMRWSIR